MLDNGKMQKKLLSLVLVLETASLWSCLRYWLLQGRIICQALRYNLNIK